MKKFVFTLQAVYGVTLSEEKQQKLEIKRLEDLLARLRAERDEAQNAFMESKVRCACELEKGMPKDKLNQYSLYFESMINMLELLRENILRTEAERDQWIQKRIKTRNKLKTLEKIRDAQLEEYKIELRKEEDKDIGDLVSYQVAAK